jgi:cell division protein FtsL
MNEYNIQANSCLINRDKNAFVRVTTSLVEKSRYFVLLVVATVLIVSITIFVMGTLHFFITINHI